MENKVDTVEEIVREFETTEFDHLQLREKIAEHKEYLRKYLLYAVNINLLKNDIPRDKRIKILKYYDDNFMFIKVESN